MVFPKRNQTVIAVFCFYNIHVLTIPPNEKPTVACGPFYEYFTFLLLDSFITKLRDVGILGKTPASDPDSKYYFTANTDAHMSVLKYID